MTIGTDKFIYVNIGLIIFYVAMFFRGAKKGFLRTLIDLVGTLVSVWLAWVVAPVMSDFARIFPQDMNPLQGTLLSSAIYRYLNELLWFLILFAVMKIIFAMIESIAKSAKKVPVLSQVSGIFGGMLQLGVAVIWTLVFCAILGMPTFKKGAEVVDATLLGKVRNTAALVAEKYVQPFMNAESFGELFQNAEKLTEQQRNDIRQWLIGQGYDESKADELLSDYIDKNDQEDTQPQSSAIPEEGE